jgi:hypothetical protein
MTEIPYVPETSIQFPPRYDSYKALVSREQSLFKQAENKGGSPSLESLEARYGSRFKGQEPSGTWVHVQLRDKDSESIADKTTFDGENVDVVARFWFIGKNDETGKLGAICYKLGTDGSVYKQTSEQSRYDKEQGMRFWALGEVEKLDDTSAGLELYSRIDNLQAPAQRIAA